MLFVFISRKNSKFVELLQSFLTLEKNKKDIHLKILVYEPCDVHRYKIFIVTPSYNFHGEGGQM